MKKTILLDAGPLGYLCAPAGKQGLSARCKQWMADCIRARFRIIVPEIADYEVRRELIRAGLTRSLIRLDSLGRDFEYLAISTVSIRKAADIWALARQKGQPTAGDKSIDADAILAAQALALAEPTYVIATTNVGHLSRFAHAMIWDQITTA